jgi:hypothetical protein
VAVANPCFWAASMRSPMVAPPSARAVRLRGSIDTAPHRRAIDDDAVVTQCPSRKVMSSTTNRECQSVRTRPPDDVNNVLRISAANQRCRPFVNLAIPELASLVIGGVLRKDEMPGKESFELLENRADPCVSPLGACPRIALFSAFCSVRY